MTRHSRPLAQRPRHMGDTLLIGALVWMNSHPSKLNNFMLYLPMVFVTCRNYFDCEPWPGAFKKNLLVRFALSLLNHLVTILKTSFLCVCEWYMIYYNIYITYNIYIYIYLYTLRFLVSRPQIATLWEAYYLYSLRETYWEKFLLLDLRKIKTVPM